MKPPPPARWTVELARLAERASPLGRRPLRMSSEERELWSELLRLRCNARRRAQRARLRDDPAKLREYLDRNAAEAARYRARLAELGERAPRGLVRPLSDGQQAPAVDATPRRCVVHAITSCPCDPTHP